ncbi:MAG TPA: hypothetical protein VFP59_10275 [Candidatus Angelobacter sp.]|nr:hypothetical protein [Candidatus Angelobacter sp.]
MSSGLQQQFSSLSVRSERDSAVDLIKGVACLLMVVAHVHFTQAPWLQFVTMAAVLFFATTGMNLAGIVEKRPGHEARLAANALFLIFAGFADNYVQGTLGMCDVFQSAGMGILAMLLLRRLWPSCWTWLFPIPFLIHFANQQFHWKTEAVGLSSFFLTPGLFPLLPWLSFYLLGAHLKKYSNPGSGWLIGVAAVAVLAIFSVFRPFQFNKFWMSPEYFLIGCAAAACSVAVLRQWLPGAGGNTLAEIRLWGANSLVYYITNNFVIRVLEMVMSHGVALFLLSIIITTLLLRPALATQAWTGRQRPETVLLAGAILVTATLAANHHLWPGSFRLGTLASFGLTFSFVFCQPAWKNLSRAMTRPGAQSGSARGQREKLARVPGF